MLPGYGFLPVLGNGGPNFPGQIAAMFYLGFMIVSNFISQREVRMIVTGMLDRIHIANRFVIVSCTRAGLRV
jgi:hypothetical protein